MSDDTIVANSCPDNSGFAREGCRLPNNDHKLSHVKNVNADPVDHDGLFKQLLFTFFKEFIELFVPGMEQYGDLSDVRPVATETFYDAQELGQRRADLVVRVQFADGSGAYFIVHVEVESQARTDTAFAKRMFHYFARLHELHNEPIYPIALFAHDTATRDEPNTFIVKFPDRDVLRFEFLVIHLKKLDWRKYLRTNNPLAAALMAKMGIAREDRPKAKLECLRLLLRAEPNPERRQILGRFIDTYLPLDKSEEQQYDELMGAIPLTEKQAVTEFLTSWERKGLEKGLKQGREEGRKEVREKMRNALRTLIEARFGPMPTDDLFALAQLPLDALEQMTLVAGTATSYDAVREQLHKTNTAKQD